MCELKVCDLERDHSAAWPLSDGVGVGRSMKRLAIVMPVLDLAIAAVRRLVQMPELRNQLPAPIMRSRLRFTPVHTVRGMRHSGRSKMNFPGLVNLGLSAMS